MVDIIVLVHNQAEITDRFFKKLFKNTNMKQVRLIVVDNGSDVPAKKVIKKYLRTNDEPITKFANVGFCKGVNSALEVVKSEYFCLLNNDVLVTPGWLDRLLKKLRANDKAGAIGAVANFASGKQRLVPEDTRACINPDNYEDFRPTVDFELERDRTGKVVRSSKDKLDTIWKTPVLAFFAVLFKSEVIKEVGMLDEQFSPAYSEDWDYSFRMVDKGYELLVDRETFVYHFGEATANEIVRSAGANKRLMYQQSNEKLVNKWGQDNINKRFQSDRDFRRLDPNSVAIAIPNTGSVSHYFLFNCMSFSLFLGGTIGKDSIYLCDMPRTVVHFGRNECVKQALELGVNYIFFLDSDIKFPPGILNRLLGYRQDLVGVVVTKRVPPYNPCVYRGRKKMQDSDEIGWTWLSEIGTGLQEIDGIGMAATLINMNVFKKLKEPWFYFTESLGEDLHFCERIQKLGYKLYCDTDIQCLHEGEIEFKGWNDFVNWSLKNGGSVITGSNAEDLKKKSEEFSKDREEGKDGISRDSDKPGKADA